MSRFDDTQGRAARRAAAKNAIDTVKVENVTGVRRRVRYAVSAVETGVARTVDRVEDVDDLETAFPPALPGATDWRSSDLDEDEDNDEDEDGNDAGDEVPQEAPPMARTRTSAAPTEIDFDPPAPPGATNPDGLITDLLGWTRAFRYTPEVEMIKVSRRSPPMFRGMSAQGWLFDAYEEFDERYLGETWGGGTYSIEYNVNGGPWLPGRADEVPGPLPPGDRVALSLEIIAADEVHIWFDPKSTGSHFDRGMLFAMLRLRMTKKRDGDNNLTYMLTC